MSRPLTPPPLGGGPPPVSVFGHQCPDNVSGHVRRAWEAQHSGGGMTHVCVAVGPARPSARFLGQWEQSGQIRSLTMTELYFTVWRPEVSGQRVGRLPPQRPGRAPLRLSCRGGPCAPRPSLTSLWRIAQSASIPTRVPSPWGNLSSSLTGAPVTGPLLTLFIPAKTLVPNKVHSQVPGIGA